MKTNKSSYIYSRLITKVVLVLGLLLPQNQSLALMAEKTEDICLLAGTAPIPDSAIGAIKTAIFNAQATVNFNQADCFAPIEIRDENEWLFITFTGLKDVQPDTNWNVSEDAVWSDNIIVHMTPEIHAAVAGTTDFSIEIGKIPETLVSKESKNIIDPLAPKPEVSASATYRFPFELGYQVYYGTKGGGIHPGEFIFTGGMPSGSLAVDLLSDGNTGANHAPNRVYAAASGTVVKKCSDASKTSTYLILDNGTDRFLYAHIRTSTAPALWTQPQQNDYIGEMVPGTFNDNPCGYADQTAGFFHVHFEFPATATLTLSDWTLNTSTETWSKNTETWSSGQWKVVGGTNNGGGNICSPNADQISLYVDTNYGGSCITKDVGSYSNPGAMGIANDAVSSIKVGGNVKLTLCKDDNYSGGCDTFTGDDGNLSDNGIGDNQASSAKVEPRNAGTSCSINADQVALFLDPNHGGGCVVKGIGNYSNPGSMGIANDAISSIRVGGNVKLTLCKDDNYSGGCETFTGDDSNLSDNSIGNDQSSSAKVEARNNSLPSDYGFCAEEGQTCSFSGAAQIYYGANNQFVGPVSKSDGVACNNDVFGDPISGTHKQCFIKGGRPQGSTYCANENGTCSFGSGNIATVFFGANGKYNSQTGISSSIGCNTGTFGDPFSGIGKSCYYVITGNTISTPSNPSPTDNSTLERTSNTTLSWSTNGTNCSIHIWGGSINITPANTCGSLALGNQRGGAYNWQVTASNGGSATGAVWHFNIKPYGPTNLTISNSNASQATLNWTLSSDEPNDVDTYEIYQDGQYIGYVLKGISTYTVNGLTCGSTYNFTVKSKRQGVLSNASNTVTRGSTGCAPSAPSDLTISTATESSLTLNWSDNSNNETGFNIYRWGYDGTSWTFIYLDSVGANTTNYTQYDLVCGSDFNFYEVSAYNSNGESEHTVWSQGTTLPCQDPDLQIDISYISPNINDGGNPSGNEPVYVEMAISNTGNGPSDAGIWADLFINRSPDFCNNIGDYYTSLPSIASNDTIYKYITIENGLPQGSHNLTATVDVDCLQSEADENNNTSTQMDVNIDPAPPTPSNDDFENAKVINSNSFSESLKIWSATIANDDPDLLACYRYAGTRSIWYQFTPSKSGTVNIDTRGSTFDTMLAVWSGTRGSLTSINCNDDIGIVNGSWDQDSVLTTHLTAGNTYFIEVSRFNGEMDITSASIPDDANTRRQVDISKSNITIDIDGVNSQSIYGNLQFNFGYQPDPNPVLTTYSNPTYDGWIRESSETSKKGGTKNNTASTFNLGDDAAKKQYLGILSFNTTLPVNAVITKVTLKVKKAGIVGGGNPVNTFGGFIAQVKKPSFNTLALAINDFQAAGAQSTPAVKSSLIGDWYTLDLTGAKAQVNTSGTTQIRLKFKLDDNNNIVANYLKLYSGNAGASSAPQLIIEYYIP